MSAPPTETSVPPAQRVAQRVFSALERFLHVEAVSGVVLLAAAAIALVWANSPAAATYQHFWHAPLTFGFGDYVVSRSLHFWINDALMSVFFLVAGMEIRREIHEGALANLQLALLPLAGALGGVVVPAVFYVAMNVDPTARQGWAVPTATDIAFAVGVLALLGKSIPSGVRILLLALAIIDDIAAVIIIALFYSSGVDYTGLAIAGAGVALVLGLQQIGVGTAAAYILPGAIIWYGLLRGGVHPTLAGVVLGLLTPARRRPARRHPVEMATRALNDFDHRSQATSSDPRELMEPLKELRLAQREMLPPVVRVQMMLHPWVAYGVMPLFALANAGVHLQGIDLSTSAAQGIMLGVFIALALGKPIGILTGSWLAVRLGLCNLPTGVTWAGVLLVGCLGGIGFTMSIFIATLAFDAEDLLSAAKAGVLLASTIAGVFGMLFGWFYLKRARMRDAQSSQRDDRAATEPTAVP